MGHSNAKQSGERCSSKMPALFSLFAILSLSDLKSKLVKIIEIIEHENDKNNDKQWSGKRIIHLIQNVKN